LEHPLTTVGDREHFGLTAVAVVRLADLAAQLRDPIAEIVADRLREEADLTSRLRRRAR
jgi:hypothetical protein